MFEEIARFGTEIAAIDEHGNNISYQELVTEGDKISQDIEREVWSSLCVLIQSDRCVWICRFSKK